MKVMIVGAGKLGYKLAELMNNEDIEVTLIDKNIKTIERINDHLDVLTVNANGLELETLKKLDIKTYDLLLASTGSDEANVIICSVAKKLGCKKTIARVRNPEYIHQFDFIKDKMGIDHIVNPDLATANEIAHYLLKSYSFNNGEFAKGRVSMMDFHVNHMKDLIGKSLAELNDFENLLVVAISRDGNIIIPHGGTMLEEDDIIYIIGESKNINNFAARFRLNMDNNRIKRVMILGGGKITHYLAEQLIQANIGVTIFEQDKDRCKYLSEKLNNALIINGDGTDINLLEQEDLSSMDAFVGATGYDEQNLLMSLMAKQSGVRKVIAKISRSSYVNLIEKLDIDFALDPTNIIAGDILKFIRGGKVVSVSLLLGEQAEVTEVIMDENLSVLGKPISKLGLPKGIIIGAIVRDREVIIPNGRTIIYPKDRLVIFCLESNAPHLKAFFKSTRGGVMDELRNYNQGIRKFIGF
ncbi:MAG: Trk system potassium transporter TrkA [Clostridiales bacterium]|nr:Trk system potassium transporter TrkA [Clostridiales bacterium]